MSNLPEKLDLSSLRRHFGHRQNFITNANSCIQRWNWRPALEVLKARFINLTEVASLEPSRCKWRQMKGILFPKRMALNQLIDSITRQLSCGRCESLSMLLIHIVSRIADVRENRRCRCDRVGYRINVSY